MDELELEFQLDAQLAADTIKLGDFPLSSVLLMNDSQYPWLILVPRRAGMTEIYHLSERDQQQMLQETSALAQALSDIFAAKKMNIANLGNMVSQLHIHVIARLESDPAWPGPVWGKVPAMPYNADELASVKERLDALLAGEVAFTPV